MSDLPELVEMDSFDGDYVDRFKSYMDALYEIYKTEVAYGRLRFKGEKVNCQFRPETNGKHYAFWHMMQEDGSHSGSEEDRNIDLERCQRIHWIAWMIQKAETDERIRVFPQTMRGGNRSWALWIPDEKYVVILWERNGYYLLKTAFVVQYKGTARNLERDWMAYEKG